jgi:hypothetical protein
MMRACRLPSRLRCGLKDPRLRSFRLLRKKEEDSEENNDASLLLVAAASLLTLWGVYEYLDTKSTQKEVDDVKRKLDALTNSTPSGTITRHQHAPRPDADAKLRAAGFNFADNAGIYWNHKVCDRYWKEDASYALTQDAAAELASATYELHR